MNIEKYKSQIIVVLMGLTSVWLGAVGIHYLPDWLNFPCFFSAMIVMIASFIFIGFTIT